MGLPSNKQAYRTDHMVLIGVGLAAAYWILEAFLYVLIYGNTTFFHRLFSLDINELAMRILVLAFFLIFGSHAQYTITQRKKLDEALKDTEGKYKTIIESIEDGYFELDPAGSIIFINESMSRILGYSPDELHDMVLREVMGENDANQFDDAVRHVEQTGEPLRAFDATIIRKDGSLGYIETSISAIRDSGNKTQGFRGILRDVSRRKKAEALQREKLAAEAANRSKGEFLANMSHEIRTPLNSIIGLVELTLESELTLEQREDLRVVRSASYGLLSVINDILDFSKIEAGKLELEKTEFKLRRLLNESLRIMAGKAHDKGIELAYRVTPGIPEKLIGDPARLRQVILNLVGNAIKFTETGEVVVTVSEESMTEKEAVLHFSVRDTGIGIPGEKQEKIFGAFDQADGSTSRRFGGTGLGLAVSAQLVELMQGRIWVDSKPNQGSEFHYTAVFEIKSSETIDPSNQAEWMFSLHGVRVLIVDDNATCRDILKETLEHYRMFPIGCHSPKEAMMLLEQRANNGVPFDLVLLDADIPEGEGVSFAQWLFSQPQFRVAMVMMYTTHSRKHNRIEYARLGERSYVYKPISDDELLQAMESAIRGIHTPVRPKELNKSSEVLSSTKVSGLKVLVAEDLHFNQKFITRLLERWGHSYVLVENGKQAVEAFKKEAFDIILMDVQMPEMDGLEATKTIREFEFRTQGHIPIIAMTAHAMKGDRERCLTAGMDEYISKPIKSDTLRKKINQITPRLPAGGRQESESTPRGQRNALPLDKDALLDSFDGETDLLREVVDIFISDYPDLLRTIETSVTERKSDELRRAAHDLKGMLKNFQADDAAEDAYELEKMGHLGRFENGAAICTRLKKGLSALEDLLKSMI